VRLSNRAEIVILDENRRLNAEIYSLHSPRTVPIRTPGCSYPEGSPTVTVAWNSSHPRMQTSDVGYRAMPADPLLGSAAADR
jgi:hypothetical protein